MKMVFGYYENSNIYIKCYYKNDKIKGECIYWVVNITYIIYIVF